MLILVYNKKAIYTKGFLAMYYKIAVCDDEKIFVNDIIKKIKATNNEYEIIPFYSGEELLNSKLDFNIIFLDIVMTGLDGINTAFTLRENNYDGIIIFLTSHTEFMPDAFKVNAFRFLNKPIEEDKFNEAFAAAQKNILNTNHILINNEKNAIYLKYTDIIYFEAFGDGTYIYDKNGNIYVTDKQLKYWNEQVGNEHFFQIHKSFTVSFLYVKNISKDFKVTLRNCQQTLVVSRRKYLPFRTAFFDYIRKYAKVM